MTQAVLQHCQSNIPTAGVLAMTPQRKIQQHNDTGHQDMNVVRTMKLGTKRCNANAMVLLSEDEAILAPFLRANAVATSRKRCVGNNCTRHCSPFSRVAKFHADTIHDPGFLAALPVERPKNWYRICGSEAGNITGGCVD